MTGEVTLKWNVNRDLVAQRRAKDLVEFYNWNDLLLFLFLDIALLSFSRHSLLQLGHQNGAFSFTKQLQDL